MSSKLDQNNNTSQSKKYSIVFDVYIKKNVLESIKEHCRQGGKLEVFGYLVGEVFEWTKKTYVIVEDELFIKESGDSQKYTIAQLEGYSGHFQKLLNELREKKKKNLLTVGWWHSHPNYGCFLSTTDVTTTHYFFSEKYHVALVCEPIRNDFAFFKIDKHQNEQYAEVSYAIIDQN
jgi:26S proteasome regulatory subunit N11